MPPSAPVNPVDFPRLAPAPGRPTDAGPEARRAYDAMAELYDAWTADYDYERWLERLEALAHEHGLRGRRLLDVACGTGRSFAPMLARGYEVTACDLSPRMLARAAERLGTAGRAVLADMRALPDLGPFDLVTCLDDSVNYLLAVEDLDATLTGIARQLRPGGVLVFDVNTLRTYRTSFASAWTDVVNGAELAWRGEAGPQAEAGALCAARLEIRRPGRLPRVVAHRQRHWPVAVLGERLARAGLTLAAVRGQATGAVLHPDLDETRDTKAVLVAHRPSPAHPDPHRRPNVLIKP